MPNGNLLISSSRGGRVFEVTPGGRIVWQLVPGWLPLRPKRYARDYCPQLSQLQYEPARSTVSRYPAGYVDRDMYSFVFTPWPTKLEVVDGEAVHLLKDPQICRRVFLPEESAVLQTQFSYREARGRKKPPAKIHFRVELRDPLGAPPEIVFEDTIETRESELRVARVDLSGHELRDVSICLFSTRPNGKPAVELGWWGVPSIETGTPQLHALPVPAIDAAEAAADEVHLRALGYVE
jgi:hypothetical protein